jgi:hypothetical protein
MYTMLSQVQELWTAEDEDFGNFERRFREHMQSLRPNQRVNNITKWDGGNQANLSEKERLFLQMSNKITVGAF